MQRRLPLNSLRAFEAAARHLSVTRAAAELNVTHSAISHHIRTLEATLGVSLFDRAGGKFRLTGPGVGLLGSISRAFAMIAEGAARAVHPATQGQLTVSCAPALLSFWLIPAIQSFIDAFPAVTLRIVSSSGPLGALPEGGDLHIHYGEGPWSGFSVRLLTPVTLVPVCSPTLIHNRRLRSIADLDDHVLLHADEGREWRALIASLREGHFTPQREYFFSNAQLAMEAATVAVGLALADRLTARHALARGRLVAPFDATVAAPHAYYVVTRTEAPANSVIAAFVDWLQTAILAMDSR